MRIITVLAAFLIFVVCGAAVCTGSSKLIEMKVGETTYRGKLIAHNRSHCWLLDRDGRLYVLDLSKVDAKRTLNISFRRASSAEMRSRLRREFGKTYEISGTTHYLVCAARGRAKKYANLFEDIYRSFHVNFGSRGFQISKPEFPLVAIVFPDRQSFVEYAKKDGVRASSGLRGYYKMMSNRVAVFDSGQELVGSGPAAVESIRMAASEPAVPFQRQRIRLPLMEATSGRQAAKLTWYGSIKAGLKDTIVHETTHQVAFNTGLHSRIGANPRWVVEGLATVFEADGIRDGAGQRGSIGRINRGRYLQFGNFADSRRQPNSLADFLKDDKAFFESPADAYAQSWALSFYLIETRSRAYTTYMKRIAKRDPMKPYPPEERLSEFQDAFGSNLDQFEQRFLRYFKRLK